ncbi:MAG: thioredoxin family protein [Gemmatimonas sp.]|nr:thioredoxin family protein [Gemmatimonas sp.]
MRRAMILTLSGALALLLAVPALAALAPGAKAPDFDLVDTAGNHHSLQKYLADGQIVVLEWFNPDCPFIVKHHKLHRTMDTTFAAVKDQGVVWLAVNSSAPGKSGHGAERNAKAVEEYGMTFPVLLDPTGAAGMAYEARNTPTMFVIGRDGLIAYAGAIDDDKSPQVLGGTNHVAAALAAVLAGGKPDVAETKPYGCSVKYAD